jgi:uncharacterized protein
MFELFKKIMPKEEKFFDLFEAHAIKIKAGAETLRSILDGGKDVAAKCATLAKLEDDADHISHDVMQAIRKSFITPFDRSDIKGLITAMDDAIDQMNKTAKAVMLFEVTSFEPNMRAMGDQAVKLAELTADAVPLLRNVNSNSARLHALTGEIIRIEEDSDHLNDDGLRALLKGKGKSKPDPMAYIISSQIYEHLEKVADRFEDVANVVSGIVIEHV